MSPHPAKFIELVKKLREIFQIDKPELDFGVYRILNARAGEINDYLETRLPEKIKVALNKNTDTNKEQVARELQEKEAQYQQDGINPDSVPKILELRQKLASYTNGNAEHENAVFSHLLTFFSRYYDNGDFISQRRYKGDTYAIPYAGEEVMLHWANKDQYYTKSGENFSNYSFKLDDGQGGVRTVHCRLVAADTAKDNRKDNDKERRFALIEKKTVTRIDDGGEEFEEELLPVEAIDKLSVENGVEVLKSSELILRFEYIPMPKGSKQSDLTTKAVQTILTDSIVQEKWLDLSRRAPTEKDPQRTLLEKHLTDYTTKNTADYFIHKDLGGFLKRELDFYIKNEVMHLDNVQDAEKFADIEKSLRMIQCLRTIALELITFLAQFEDFQKKLWLKKKFVVSSHYCMTLDSVPEELYPEIAVNQKQWDAWRSLDISLQNSKDDLFKSGNFGSIQFIKSNLYLMIDTSLFPLEFKTKLLNSIVNLDVALDGVLIHGENYQAINLMVERYRSHAKFVYMDPPYNTGKDGFLYKDNYSHSTWMAFITSRLKAVRSLLRDDGAIFCSLDDSEATNFESAVLCGEVGLEIPANFFVQVRYPNKTLSEDSDYHKTIERVILLAKGAKSFKPIKQTTPYVIDKFEWKIVEGKSSEEISIGGKKVEIFKPGSYEIQKTPPGIKGLKETWATGSLARQKGSSGEFLDLYLAPRKEIDGLSCLYKVYGIGLDGLGYRYFTGPKREDATKGKFFSGIPLSTLQDIENGNATKDLPIANFLDFSADFGNCRHEGGVDISGGKKPERFVSNFLSLASEVNSDDLVVDPFAGSGTTPAVALQMGKKFIAIEVSEYLRSKIIPRMQRVYLGTNNALINKPKSGLFKYIQIESYEDTLNNLALQRSTAQEDWLNSTSPENRDDYLLRYMLDVESRGSLLPVEAFRKPFNVKLKVAVDSAGAFEERTIDLVETFNYLIGLTVKTMELAIDRGYARIEGTLPTGERTLILWRDCERIGYEELTRYTNRFDLNTREETFDVVYINGDHNIPTVFTATEEEGGVTRTMKLRQIEPEFLQRMFSVEDI